MPLTTYNKALLTSGQEEVAVKIIADSQTNNRRTVDPVAFMEQPGNAHSAEPHYGNAQNLGYYSGSVQAAIDGMTADATQSYCRIDAHPFGIRPHTIGRCVRYRIL